MDHNYDLEAAKQKIPATIEIVENFTPARCNQVKETVMEIAKQVNADKLTKIVNQFCECVDAISALCQEVLGADGDSVTEGSLYGALAYTKKMDEAMNGV